MTQKRSAFTTSRYDLLLLQHLTHNHLELAGHDDLIRWMMTDPCGGICVCAGGGAGEDPRWPPPCAVH